MKIPSKENELRFTGIDIIGNIPWGTHFCNFFYSKQDLLATLVPYFKAGLENNEFCLWITSDPVSVEDAMASLRNGIPLLDQYLTSNAIEVSSHADWYLKDGLFNPKRVIDGWNEKLNDALVRGHEGMRVNGNEAWVERQVWKDFIEYERELNNSILDKRMIVMCTYPLDKCNGADVLDVAHVHEMAVAMRSGEWEIVEKPQLKRSKAEINKLKDQVEKLAEARNTQLIQALQEVKLSAERFSRLFHLNPFLPMVLSEWDDGRYIEVNASFTDLFGFTPGEVIGKTSRELDFWVDLAQRDAFLANIKEGGMVKNAEVELKAKNGTILDVRFSMIALPMNDGPKVLSMALDCTEQKAAEKMLSESEQNLDVLINSSPGEIWLASKDLKLVKANKAFFKSLKKFIGAEITEGDTLIAPGFPEEIKELWERLYRQALMGENIVHINRVEEPDGSEIYLEVRLNPVRSEDNAIIGIGCFSNDITELIQFRKSLELKVSLRTQELQKALEKEKELTIWKARFASMVSHEFRMPLATIKNTANYVRKYKNRLAPESLGNKIGIVLEQVDLMTRMMGDLLVLGSADENKIAVVKRKVEIRSFFESLKKDIEEINNGSHTIVFQFGFEHKHIDADDDLLRNIFVNLMSNAIKFSPGTPRVWVHVHDLGENLRVEIKDKGIGISEEDLTKIFEPFERGKNTKGIQGTGLGLSIVKKAVDLMGGTIDVSSKPGEGSVFTVTIPVK
ncbi:MEDS domain-containing protein [Parachryseolinea silvisoli]|uniref:MEDS domain-containing protein n=1 Tax=Parachryseolinea silvisoli TaxID=2873601 RepID=UPI002265EB27|nr:MEDS domain-containing protein [Parachryseolinea silvisoli]MCD9018206.1 MEDS domain-containing protein [Parachryseolinea silvisoli]